MRWLPRRKNPKEWTPKYATSTKSRFANPVEESMVQQDAITRLRQEYEPKINVMIDQILNAAVNLPGFAVLPPADKLNFTDPELRKHVHAMFFGIAWKKVQEKHLPRYVQMVMGEAAPAISIGTGPLNDLEKRDVLLFHVRKQLAQPGVFTEYANEVASISKEAKEAKVREIYERAKNGWLHGNGIPAQDYHYGWMLKDIRTNPLLSKYLPFTPSTSDPEAVVDKIDFEKFFDVRVPGLEARLTA